MLCALILYMRQQLCLQILKQNEMFYMVTIQSIAKKGDIGEENFVDFIFDGIMDICNNITWLYSANTLEDAGE